MQGVLSEGIPGRRCSLCLITLNVLAQQLNALWKSMLWTHTVLTYVYLPLIQPIATTVNFQKCCSPATYITQNAASECVPVYEELVQSYCCACRVAPCTYFEPHQLPELSVHFGLT